MDLLPNKDDSKLEIKTVSDDSKEKKVWVKNLSEHPISYFDEVMYIVRVCFFFVRLDLVSIHCVRNQQTHLQVSKCYRDSMCKARESFLWFVNGTNINITFVFAVLLTKRPLLYGAGKFLADEV